MVPNSVETGAVQLVWSNPRTSTAAASTETALIEGSITVTGSHR